MREGMTGENRKLRTSRGPAVLVAYGIAAALSMALFPLGASAAFPFRLGSGFVDGANDVTVGEGGNVYVVGSFQGVVDFDPTSRLDERISISDPSSSLEVDAFVAKYTAAGDLIWVRAISGKGPQVLNAVAFRNGTVFMGGSAAGVTAFEGRSNVKFDVGFGRDAMLAACNVDGEWLWTMRMGDEETGEYEWDDDRAEEVLDLATDGDANLFVAGAFNGTIDLNSTNGPTVWDTFRSASGEDGYRTRDAFAASYEADGRYRWGFAVGDVGRDEGCAVGAAPDGAMYLAGFVGSPADFAPGDWITNGGYVGAGRDGFLAKYNTNSTLQWVIGFGGGGDDRVGPGALAVIGPAGNETVVVGGQFEATADFAPGAAVAELTSAGGKDAFIASYTRTGLLQWVRAGAGPAGDDLVAGVAEADDGRIVASGQFTGSLSFAGEHGDITLEVVGASDAFVVELDTAGQARWAGRLGGDDAAASDGGECASAVAWTPAGEVLAVGRFFGSTDLDLGAAVVEATAMGNSDIFVALRPAGPPPRTLTSVAISGASALFEGLQTTLTCLASFSDGSSEDVTSTATWALVGAAPTGMSIVAGTLQAGLVGTDTMVTVSAMLQRDGVDVGATYELTVRNVRSARQRPGFPR